MLWILYCTWKRAHQYLCPCMLELLTGKAKAYKVDKCTCSSFFGMCRNMLVTEGLTVECKEYTMKEVETQLTDFR